LYQQFRRCGGGDRISLEVFVPITTIAIVVYGGIIWVLEGNSFRNSS
jgi:hypothetical protein